MDSYPPTFPQPRNPPAYSAPPGPPPPASFSGVQFTRDADFLIQSFLPSSPVSHQGLSGIPLPFCAPQIADSFDAPFARGYNAALHDSVGLSQDQLLAFIDGLNLAMTSSPPLRVVNFAGMVIGFVYAPKTGMHILSKTLTDRYLRAANVRLFKPRGLAVRLCTTAAMQHLVMRTGNGAGPSTMTKIGRGVGTPPKVHASISDVGDGRKMPLATQRRLASLEGYALHLQLDVPPPAKAQGVMDTMGSWGVAFDQWRDGRKQDKIEQKRRQLERVNSELQRLGINPNGGPLPQMGGQPGYAQPGSGGQGYSGQPGYAGQAYGGQPGYGGGGPSNYGGGQQPGGYDAMGRHERKDLRRAAKRSRRRERGPGLIGSLIGPKESKLERRVANADLIEHWKSDKGLWVVIMNAELDKEIEGIERAESMDNEEQVDPQTWRAEIIRERDILEEESDSDSEDEDGGHHGDQKSHEYYGDHKDHKQ
ncbi:hypothetical protein C8F04DRAFT_1140307 [Mycena alexandri]|uniref:Uncharacterized protein n=1 Tax=Mycena alexandri TaxID=1745969 RepID=A0AAD6S682_9AGAR|nr:hypothetical protein C8F04DRAFT_1140307 [Mycena alexandri]